MHKSEHFVNFKIVVSRTRKKVQTAAETEPLHKDAPTLVDSLNLAPLHQTATSCGTGFEIR
ncbi:hypothetical protein D3C84_771560 [compost metagenome]